MLLLDRFKKACHIYIAPLFDMIDTFPNIRFHSYADDIQIYIPASNPNDLVHFFANVYLSNCCKQNSLMRNEFKSSFIMSSFINNKIRKSNFQLFRICGISKSLTLFERKTLVTSFVLSVIDYCSILLSGLPTYKIKPLETILRSAVSVVYTIPHCEKNNDISITLLTIKLTGCPLQTE